MSIEKAKQWIGIIGVLEDKNYLSLQATMNAFNNIERYYNIKDMSKLVDETIPKVDFESSSAHVDVVWFDEAENSK